MIKKYFGTDGIRGKVGSSLITPNFVMRLGNAFGQILSKDQLPQTVIIGQDTRISSDMLKSAFISGITATGINVINLGTVPTPAVAFMVKASRSTAGIMISASHNPYYDNGIKLFSRKGYKLSDELESQIENQLTKKFYYHQEGKFGEIYNKINAVRPYVEHCVSLFSNKINSFLKNKKIIVDYANGALLRVAKEVFTRLNLNILDLAAKPDGLNINQECGALNLYNLRSMIISQKADLGISFDGDGDRVILIDEFGNTLNGDDILLLLAKYNKDVHGVVGTLMTNFMFEKEYKNLNLLFDRAQVGDRHVIEHLLKKNLFLGGEPSGHIIDLRYNSTGDGLIAALQVLTLAAKLKKPLSKLHKIEKAPQLMTNIKLKKKFDVNDMKLLIKDINFVKKSLSDNGRVVVRPSGTESTLRVMVEATTTSLATTWMNYLVHRVEEKLNYQEME